MSYLDNIARPAVNAFQPVYCLKCGVIVGIRAGGGMVTDGAADEEIEDRVVTHMEFHARIDRIERLLESLGYGEP